MVRHFIKLPYRMVVFPTENKANALFLLNISKENTYIFTISCQVASLAQMSVSQYDR